MTRRTRPGAPAGPHARLRNPEGPVWLGPLAIVMAFAALLWACRGFTLGVAVADDYAFLARWRFQRPLDPFDSMGATFYWRPLSRQAHFGLIGGALPDAAWMAALVNASLLVATAWLLYRIARRWLTPSLAAAVAVIPLLSEPARALLTWPSGAQHLLAGACAALAVHEALAGRRITTALVGLGGLLSHESAFFVLLVLPVMAWWRGAGDGKARWRAAIVMAAVVAGVVAVWAIGYAVARAHGVALPPRPDGAFPLSRLPELAGRAVRAGLDLEDLATHFAGPVRVLFAVLGLATLVAFVRPAVRQRLRTYAPAIVVGLAVFLLGSLPLAWLLPDWNAWRAWIPMLGLVGALTLVCAAAAPWLALGFATLRFALMLVATPGPMTVTPDLPRSDSDMSFVRLVRLQRTVESVRRSMLAAAPTLTPGAAVRYWEIPRFAEVAFQDQTALRVWYRDTTLTWSTFGGIASIDQPVDVLVEFMDSQPLPGYVLEPAAVRLYIAGWRAQVARQWETADSLLVLAQQATRTRWALAYAILNNRARIAVTRGRPEEARGFLDEYAAIKGRDASYWAVSAWIEARYGNLEVARAHVQRCLALDPRNPDGLRLAAQLPR